MVYKCDYEMYNCSLKTLHRVSFMIKTTIKEFVFNVEYIHIMSTQGHGFKSKVFTVRKDESKLLLNSDHFTGLKHNDN
jgi:hypothetical protein